MKEDKEKWITEVTTSMVGSRRAQPDSDLFAKIEGRIDGDSGKSGKVVPFKQRRLAVAAAVVLLIVNVLTIRHFSKNQDVTEAQYSQSEGAASTLISSFQLYD